MNLFQRILKLRKQESELDRELRFHIETQVEEKIASGMSPAEARRATRLEFGGTEQIKQECRESRSTQWLASILQDLRFGSRILARSPGFSVTAIVVLALGIGVNTLAFSLYNLVALQYLPVRNPESLVSFLRRAPENISPVVPQASIDYYRANAHTLSAVMEILPGSPMVLDKGEQRLKTTFLSANYFSELGVAAAGGRLFDPTREDAESAAPVAVLSYRCWQRVFSGDTSVVGRTIHLDGKAATVIGITSETSAVLGTDKPDVWLPIKEHSYFVAGSKPLSDPKFDGMLLMAGRLAPGVTASQAEQELLALTNQLRKLYPKVIFDQERLQVNPAAHFFSTQDAAPVLAFVALLVLLILAVACANLGGLMLARGTNRQHEIRIRLDLGASRSRLFRQLFTESLMLGALGSLAALPVSYLAMRLTLLYTDAPSWMSALPDWRVLLFTAVMGVLAALFFGLLPTLQMLRRKPKRSWANEFVVCAQVAASCVLLILAGLLVRATLHTLYTNPGFGYEQVAAVDPGLEDHGYTPATATAYLDQLQARVQAVPGVTSVSLAMIPPLINENVRLTSIDVDGHRVLIYPNWVGREFLETMSIPLLRGRNFMPNETHAVLISESLARKRWPKEDPIGKPWKDGKDIVVGVVGNTRAMEMNNSDATEIYYPIAADQTPQMIVLIKTAGAPEGLMPAIQGITAGLDANLYPKITPLKAGFSKNLATVEQIAAIISLLGGIAIFLAVVGLLGLVTYAVAQRTKEIAIRLAIGASRFEIMRTVLRRFAWPVLIGIVAGVGGTAALSQVLRRVLYGVSSLDPIGYLGALALLVAILAVAAILPVRRAFGMDVARILHTE